MPKFVKELSEKGFSDGRCKLWIGRFVELQIYEDSNSSALATTAQVGMKMIFSHALTKIQSTGSVLSNQFIVMSTVNITFSPIVIHKSA